MYEELDSRMGHRCVNLNTKTLHERMVILKKIWKDKMGYELNLNNPKKFTEKLQLYKLCYYDPKMTQCVDKVSFKEYIKHAIGGGETAELLTVWNSPSEVDFAGLPSNYVVKSNCQSDGRYISIINEKDEIDLQGLKEEIQKYWFNSNNLLINGFCRAYHSVIPKVFVEEYIGEFASGTGEYKVFCFSGKPYFVYATNEHYKQGVMDYTTYPISFYDLEWKKLDVTYGGHRSDYDAPKPYHFDEMIKKAIILSEDFPFVRVDFCDTLNKLYVTELTFYPGGGMTPYFPVEFDRHMGDLFEISWANLE